MLFLKLLISSSSMLVSRAWTTQKWCKSVIDPQWPFAYSKYRGQTEERNGRVMSNLQDVRHKCQTRGVQSKCHICEDIDCGDANGKDNRSLCHFQWQGVSTNDMSKNIPTITDVPWAVGGSYRYDYGGQNVSHICLHMSGGQCQSNFGLDYSRCVVRCWGHSSTSNNTIKPDDGGLNADYFETDHNDRRLGGSSSPWFHKIQKQSWLYSKNPTGFILNYPRDSGHLTSAQGFTFTVAGDKDNREPGFVDGLKHDARFYHPEGLAVDHTGYIFVADTGNHAIRMISPSGNVTTIAGNGRPGFRNGNASTAQFSYPSGICVWRDWQMWPYPDPLDPYVNVYRSGNGTLTLFVADTGNHQIRKITMNDFDTESSLENVVMTLMVECFSGTCGESEEIQPKPGYSDGSREDSRFDSPRGITVSESGNVYVADTNNHLIRKIDRFGVTSTVAGMTQMRKRNVEGCNLEEGLSGPCLDGVQGYSDGETTSSKFSYPTDLVIMNEKFLLVIDSYRIRRINLERKVVETLAGSDSRNGRDGFGLHASFNKPQGIAVTNDGYIYISDASSCRIRRAFYHNRTHAVARCTDTLSTLFRPSGCSSYDDPVDSDGFKVSPISKNIYYNYKYRNISNYKYGEDFIGRQMKYCVGSPPPNKHKLVHNIDSSNSNMLVVGNPEQQFIRDDPNEGTLMTVSCPSSCSSNVIPKENILNLSFVDDEKLAFTENTSICAAAFYLGLLKRDQGDLIDVIITNIDEASIISDPNASAQQVGQAFMLQSSSTALVVQTISGTPSRLTDNLCGYADTIPSQESKFHVPYGLAAFANESLNSSNQFLYVADRDNNLIRALTATCSFPCENGGFCVAPDKCQCASGWLGIDCTTPICSNPCSERRICVAPNTCVCIPGYTGETCSDAMCVQICENGGTCSAPDTCSCKSGWFDPNCTTPVCEQTCGNGGNCTAPNTCSCPPAWTGRDCRRPVCKQRCRNGGTCVAPNTCQCPPIWSGFDCSQPVCHQGYFEPYHSTGKDVIKNWIELRPCNLTQWCSDTNTFECRHIENYKIIEPSLRNEALQTYEDSRCFAIEIPPDFVTWFPYLQSWNNTVTPYRRYSAPSPYSWSSETPREWNAKVTPQQGHTSPWKFKIDRMLAIVQLYNITQGRYLCANGGKCVAPDTCSCAKGWIGFDCRVPVCEQGFYEKELPHFVEGSSYDDNELEVFEKFMTQNVPYRLDPSGDGYSNPGYLRIVEIFLNSTFLGRHEEKTGVRERYLSLNESRQGGYQCSIRAVTEWESRSGSLFEHPNYYSRYMDQKVEDDGQIYTHWVDMGWEATYRKSSVREIQDTSLNMSHNSKKIYIYTDEGYRRAGEWARTNSSWTKGKCIIEFRRVCNEGINIFDLQLLSNGTESQEKYVIVQDTDLSFRPRVKHDNFRTYLDGIWSLKDECVDHVIRGCYNNGTCIAPNTCECAEGWTGYDCTIPVCEQKCLHHGNCTLPNTCTCEKGWSGEDCSIPLCAQECNNGGVCVAPDTCECNRWENSWRDGQIEGGVPLFQTPNGSPQLTGWTGYDCSTPICVQAQSFILNIDMKSPGDRLDLVALGGHGKDGRLECNDIRCPQYDDTVLVNNGRSFQTGCGNDPVITGCCYERNLSDQHKNSFVCMKCPPENLAKKAHFAFCEPKAIRSWNYKDKNSIPSNFKGRDGTIRMCGPFHNPGGINGTEYYVSTDPFAKPEWNNRNYESNFTSDHFLCNRHIWVQGDYIENAEPETEIAVGSNFGSAKGRHIRINHENYIKNETTNRWTQGETIAGEGIYACHNGGSCIAPDVCTCKDGYSGFDCKTPLCRHRQLNGSVIGCLNGGICVDKDRCECPQTLSILWKKFPQHAEGGITGWTGTDCSTPICTQGFFDPDCKDNSVIMEGEGCYRCANGGMCVAPDSCQCAEGWTGYDCKTPVCVAKATDIIRKQLMTEDEAKIRIFEMDPCAMEGFDSRQLLTGHRETRGKCVMPNQCTCTCRKTHHSRLCRLLGGDYCKRPFQDHFFRHRNILQPNEVFGTRSCSSGYEGAVDDHDKLISCHLHIYEPTFYVENTRSIMVWGIVLILLLIWTFVTISRRKHAYHMTNRFEKRQYKRD